MARQRSPNRDKAFEIYKDNNGDITLREIANKLDTPEKTISAWKVKDKWNYRINGVLQNEYSDKDTRGGKHKNKNAEKFGFFSKYLPEETLEITKEIETKDRLDILWEQITIQYAAIIRAQKIMFVENKDEIIKVLKKEESSEYGNKKEWEYQFAWDRQANFLNAQSRAMSELRSAIKQYDEMINKNWKMATEEQKARIDKLKLEVENIKGDNKDNSNKDWIDAIKAIAEKRNKQNG
ncbi:phage terminase small subunit [Metaclostridioides mangenotii]|uniref:phage terminase small subunit n=1 Tax=Metaclostridioides mangenotii TaxID=1540 RepID=UPI0026EC53AF|nr:phage terminase small subunit [Clostridioides mangenotii]